MASNGHFVLYKDNAGEWRWQFLGARNSRIIATSGEGYVRKQSATHAIDLLKAQAPGAEVIED